MENMLTGIRLMTAIEREINQLHFSKLIMLIWDKIGCDIDDNVNTVTRIYKGESIEDVVEDFQYEFTSKRILEDEQINIIHYVLYRDEIEFLAQWDDLSVMDIILYIANYIVRNEIYPVVQKVLSTPLEENNDIINDII